MAPLGMGESWFFKLKDTKNHHQKPKRNLGDHHLSGQFKIKQLGISLRETKFTRFSIYQISRFLQPKDFPYILGVSYNLKSIKNKPKNSYKQREKPNGKQVQKVMLTACLSLSILHQHVQRLYLPEYLPKMAPTRVNGKNRMCSFIWLLLQPQRTSSLEDIAQRSQLLPARLRSDSFGVVTCLAKLESQHALYCIQITTP